MHWSFYVSYFFGGAFLVNALPHLGCGVAGRPFQTPFAEPHGVGLSSSTVNVLWGAFNLLVAYLLICQVGDFDLRNLAHAATAGSGGLLMGLTCARLFGRFHGGERTGKSGGAEPG